MQRRGFFGALLAAIAAPKLLVQPESAPEPDNLWSQGVEDDVGAEMHAIRRVYVKETYGAGWIIPSEFVNVVWRDGRWVIVG